MSLLQWDDFVDTEDFEDAVWVERKMRYLAPRNALDKPIHIFVADVWTEDMLTSSLVGEPVECECGKVAVRYGTQYVWGRDKYGKLDETHVVPGQYCPHCDGGEDVG